MRIRPVTASLTPPIKKDLPWWPVEEGTEGVFRPASVDRVERWMPLRRLFSTEGFAPAKDRRRPRIHQRL